MQDIYINSQILCTYCLIHQTINQSQVKSKAAFYMVNQHLLKLACLTAKEENNDIRLAS